MDPAHQSTVGALNITKPDMNEIEAWRAEVLLAIAKLRETAPPGYPAQALLDEWEESIKYARLEAKA